MTGDFSRNTFRHDAPYSLVRMQQGRLFTDADWNEQGDILRGAERASAADIIGHAGFPDDAPGFALRVSDQTATLSIGAGTAYVNGVRHHNPGGETVQVRRVGGSGTRWEVIGGAALASSDVVAPGRAQDAARVAHHAVDDLDTRPDGIQRFRPNPPLPAGTTHVTRLTQVNRQPHLGPGTEPRANGAYTAFLKSVDLPETALDTPRLREVAFDGPDTATRDATLWQVELHSQADLTARGITQDMLRTEALARGLDPVLGPRAPGLLRARAEVSALSAGPCTLPPGAGYRSLENLLYRVALYGPRHAATHWAWSRENAQARFAYTEVDGSVLVTTGTGRDEVSALKAGDWVEIKSRDMIVGEQPGWFARVGEVVNERVALSELYEFETLDPEDLSGAPDLSALPSQGTLTRWEGGLPQPIKEGQWIDLENGVQVAFEAGVYQNGDYWTIPARAVSGDVEWRRDAVSGDPVFERPEGPRRDYAALARITRSNAGWGPITDLRTLFPATTRLERMSMTGGDGQEAMPDPLNPAARIPLAAPVSVQVMRGEMPVAGASVEFRLDGTGNGRFANGATVLRVPADMLGRAEATWHVDGTTPAQTCRATLLDRDNVPTAQAVEFHASLSRADRTSFDPTGIDALNGAVTVQEAIERLVSLQQKGCATHILTPAPGWEAVLEGFAKGENVSVCVSPGTYTLTRPVVMNGLGDVTLHGSSAGTARFQIDRSEAGLVFDGCGAVTVKDLDVSTPAGFLSGGQEDNRNGALMMLACGEVTVEGCRLSCGAAHREHRTCLMVRAHEGGGAVTSAQVRVTGTTFHVGQNQSAMILCDSDIIDVSDNVIRPKRLGTTALGVGQMVRDPAWLARVMPELIANPIEGSEDIPADDRAIRHGTWSATFRSPVPQQIWDVMVERTPPTEDDLTSEEAFAAYAKGLIEARAEKAFDDELLAPHLEHFKELIGEDEDRFRDPEFVQGLLVTSDIKASRFGREPEAGRQVALAAGGSVIAFDSPISQEDWNTMVAGSPKLKKVSKPSHLMKAAQRILEATLKNEEAAGALPSVKGWLAGIKRQQMGMMAQGIICAGRTLGRVSITGNVIRDAQVGIRVAPSHGKNSRKAARSVVIRDNHMELVALTANSGAAFGMFVGNAKTLRIEDNDLSLSPRASYEKYFEQGVRIWGHLARHMVLSGNRIAIATMGWRIEEVGEVHTSKYLWAYSGNLVEGPDGVIEMYNRPSTPLKRDATNKVVEIP